ncbi:MAG: uroporphyrinogen-III C-methyltransferase [Halofilum sp. (in: g-proteobacteria)]|nr:uroporphyrinogen-III C-methyltransferase [Halofilum sp. (in: g-proteobacteria)]
MNDQRSDDDRRVDEPAPEEADERTPAPDDARDAAADSADEPERPAETETETEPGTGTGEDEPADDRESATADGDDATASDSDSRDATATGDQGGDDARDDGGDNGSHDTATPAAPPPRRGAKWAIALALLIALAAAGAAGYLGWRLYELERRVATIPEERAAALQPLAERSALQALEGQLEQRFEQRLQSAVDAKADSLISARDEALGEVRERLATLETGVEDIRELAARDQINWRLAEIRYLLSIAQRRVLIDRDIRSAVAALEAADRAIGEFGDVRLLPLRQRIVEDLSALRSVETADIEGIALRLQNLLGRVPELPAAGSGTATTVAAGESNGTGGWWEALVTRLDRFVTVRRRDAGPEPGRPQPTTELPEADSLVLALERARSAALARDPTAYERALARAAEALDKGFAADLPKTERFREGLSWLQEQPVEVDLPDLAPTVDLAEKLSARIESSRDESPAEGDEAED